MTLKKSYVNTLTVLGSLLSYFTCTLRVRFLRVLLVEVLPLHVLILLRNHVPFCLPLPLDVLR